MASNIKGITIEIGGDTTELSKALTGVNGTSRALQSELKQVDKLLKFDSGNITLCEQKQELLTEAVAATEEKLRVLEEAERQVQEQFEKGEVSKEQYRALQREIEKTKNDLGKYETELDQAKQSSNDLEKGANDLGEEMDDLAEDVKEAGDSVDDAAGGFTVMKGALADMAADGIEAAGEALKDMVGMQQQASNQFQAATGIATESMGKYNEAMEAIYKNNFGESLQDVAEKMALVKQATGELDPTKLQTMTENLYTLEDTFGMDFSETMRGVQSLMDHFGLSADEAFNLMATGAQNGLNYTDELGDNVSEYAGKFAEAGYSADEYFMLLQNGADGGAYNLDKVNDAINEVTTRLADGTIADGIGGFSTKTQELFKAWQNGGATQKEVIDSIVADIQNTTNEQEKMNLAALAFGTMAEDGGTKFIQSLSSVGGAYDDVKGKMEEIKQIKYDDVMSELAGVGRTVQMDVIAPLVDSLMPIIKEVVDFISANLPTITALVGGFMAAFVVTKVAGILSGLIGTISTVITLVQSGIPIMTALNGVLMANPIVLIVAAIAGLVVAFVTLWNTSESFRQFWINLWETVKTACLTAWEAIKNFFLVTVPEIINNVITWFQELPGKISAFFSQILTDLITWGSNMLANATAAVTNLVTSITTWFSQLPGNIWNFLLTIINNIVTWGSNIVSSATAAATNLVTNVTTWISQLPGKIWSFLLTIINNVITWGANIVSNAKSAASNMLNGVISFISQLPGRIMTFLSNVISNVVSWGSNLVSNAKSAASNMLNSVVSGIASMPGRVASKLGEVISSVVSWGGNMVSQFSSIGRNVISGLINGITGMVGSLYSSIKNALGGLVDKAKSALGIHSPSKVFEEEVGKFIPPGIGQGVEKNMPELMKDTDEALGDYAKQVANNTKIKLGVEEDDVSSMVSGRRIVASQDLKSSTSNKTQKQAAGNSFTQNVNITSNRELSPSETARQTRNATRQMILALQRG